MPSGTKICKEKKFMERLAKCRDDVGIRPYKLKLVELCAIIRYNITTKLRRVSNMKLKMIPLAICAILLFAGCNANVKPKASYRQIDMTEAVTMMAEETDYIILDVRTQEEFAAGHIPNAINIPNEAIGATEIPELPNKDQLILVYCRSGNRSKQASEKLVALGYTNIVEFGGINSWPGEVVTD